MVSILWMVLLGCGAKSQWETCELTQERLGAAIQISGTVDSDHFGQAIASGDVDGDGRMDVLVGSPNYDPTSDANFNAGMVSLFLGKDLLDGSFEEVDAALRIVGIDEAAGFGSSLALSDVDGDGLADLWIGAHQGETTGQDTGIVHLFWGHAVQDLLNGDVLQSTAADVLLVGEANYDYAGFVIRSAGDVDGDDQQDILIGAHQADVTESDVGKTYLLFASTLENLSGEHSLSEADAIFVGAAKQDFSGYSIDGGSDVDKDGLADILIGAGNHDGSSEDSGAAYLFLAKSIVPGIASVEEADLKIIGANAGDWAGRAVVALPHADRDKRGDWAISSSWNDESANNSGKVSIVTGDTLWSAIKSGESILFLSDADLEIVGLEQEGFLGQVLLAGDVDGDRYTDLLIGSPLHDGDALVGENRADAGRIHIVTGATWQDRWGESLTVEDAAYTLSGSVAYDSAGTSLAIGDINKDGQEDILVGTPYADEGGLDAGSVSIFIGCGE